MKNILKFGVIACAIMVPVLANAATTAELKLIGTITPASCVPNFTGGSTIDYGTIPASTLNATEQSRLPNKSTSFTVTCDAPVKFGFSVIDERSATAVAEIGSSFQAYGLGAADNGANIGGYWLSINNGTADTGEVEKLRSLDGGVTWEAFAGNIYADGEAAVFAFGDSVSSQTPTAHKSVSVDLDVFAYIDKTDNLPIADEIKIDGLATIEVKYL